MNAVKFPAKFSPEIIAVLDSIVPGGLVLDPFAGIGGVHALANPLRWTLGIEIEREWAACHPDTLHDDAFELLRFFAGSAICQFTSIVTSPTYGNRFADAHQAKDGSTRRSYTHDLRAMTGDTKRKLHANNSGTMHFGPRYIDFHRRAWSLLPGVLVPRGWAFVNVSDFIRRGKRVPVVSTHRGLLKRAGFVIVEERHVETKRMRYGENDKARVEYEAIIVAQKQE